MTDTRRRLFLIRHGQSDFDSREFRETPRGRQWDPPLSSRGRDQAQLLAARLLSMPRPGAVFSSPFRRCRETVAPFADPAGIEVEIAEDVGEVFIGTWEGVSFEEIVSGDEELARRFREQEPMFGLAPGGETGSELRARIWRAIESIIERNPEGDVYLFAHGGVINAYVMMCLGITGRDMFFLPDNTAVNTVHLVGDRREVHFINDTRHLTDPLVFRDLDP